MKTTIQIEVMIKRSKRLRKSMPEYDSFGGDNHGPMMEQETELERCIGLENFQLEERLDSLAEDDPDMENPLMTAQVNAIDWIMDQIDDLVEESDIKMWEKIKSKRISDAIEQS